MKKNLNCILAFAPLVCVIAGIVLVMISGIVGGIVGEGAVLVICSILSILGFILVFAGVIADLVVMVYYGVLVCKRKDLEVGMKVLWCVLLYFFNILIFPICYFVVLRKEQ